MICYIYKVRPGNFLSKKDSKEHKGYNIGLLSLEGSKFNLETFIDNKDVSNIFSGFKNFNVSNDFKAGFYEVDIDEFSVYVPQGTQYQKKIISISSKVTDWEKVRCYLDI